MLIVGYDLSDRDILVRMAPQTQKHLNSCSISSNLNYFGIGDNLNKPCSNCGNYFLKNMAEISHPQRQGVLEMLSEEASHRVLYSHLTADAIHKSKALLTPP